MGLKLNIGAGLQARKEPGQLNCDLYLGPNIDVVFNACEPWPFKDESVDSIYACHVLEHLPDHFAFFKEAWRVLKPSPTYNLTMRLPYGPGNNGIGDLTHLRMWVPSNFACLQPGYGEAVYNPQHVGHGEFWSIMNCYLRICPTFRWLVKPIIWRWGLQLIQHLWGGYDEMIVGMRALKTAPEVLRWKMENTGNAVPIAHCMYQHEYEGRALDKTERLRMLFFGNGAKELQRQNDEQLACIQSSI